MYDVEKDYIIVLDEYTTQLHIVGETDPVSANTRNAFTTGRNLIKQRYHIVKKNPELSGFLFVWSTIGRILSYLLFNRSFTDFLLAAGHILGLFELLIGKVEQTKGE